MNIKVHFDLTFPLVLTTIFIVFKGLNIINWAWYWLISPMWITVIIILIIGAIFKIKELI